MKKLMITLLILPTLLFSEINVPKVNKTLQGILANKKLSFYSANNKIKLKKSLNPTSLHDADIVVFAKASKSKKVTIVNSYRDLAKTPHSIGAIYLKKGRTQIVFVKERLEEHGLVLAPSLKKHLIRQDQLNKIALVSIIK